MPALSLSKNRLETQITAIRRGILGFQAVSRHRRPWLHNKRRVFAVGCVLRDGFVDGIKRSNVDSHTSVLGIKTRGCLQGEGGAGAETPRLDIEPPDSPWPLVTHDFSENQSDDVAPNNAGSIFWTLGGELGVFTRCRFYPSGGKKGQEKQRPVLKLENDVSMLENLCCWLTI